MTEKDRKEEKEGRKGTSTVIKGTCTFYPVTFFLSFYYEKIKTAVLNSHIIHKYSAETVFQGEFSCTFCPDEGRKNETGRSISKKSYTYS